MQQLCVHFWGYAIIWTIEGKFQWNLNQNNTKFPFKIMDLNVSFAKCRPCCLSLFSISLRGSHTPTYYQCALVMLIQQQMKLHILWWKTVTCIGSGWIETIWPLSHVTTHFQHVKWVVNSLNTSRCCCNFGRFNHTVFKIRTICHARDLWKLALSYKQLHLLCPPGP